MDQWFIRIDHVAANVSSLTSMRNAECEAQNEDQSRLTSAATGAVAFRHNAIAAIDQVTWVPDWGINRIKGAVESRPDWCISRQRTWGVPLPAFYDAQGEPILDAAVVRNVAALVDQHGSNVCFEQTAEELWQKVKPADWTGPDATAKSGDTLDVWIDSGSSSRAVLKQRSELTFPADVYLEGSDQHRGWFQSSLLLSLAGHGAPPFKTVLTHGFMVDADREKISKSKQGQGGYEKPQTAEAYVGRYGADIVRLWVASQDYRNDIVVSEERLNKVAETYRALRNTLRYQLSNLYDFDPAKHAVTDDRLTGLDRWILGEFAKLEADVAAAYDAYEFHVVYQKISQFAVVELSSIYHDVIKDRMYTDAANSPRRRSSQTALHRMVTSLCQMLSPILAFTADEAWEFVPGKATESVHASEWVMAGLERSADEILNWSYVYAERGGVLGKLEEARQSKLIGKSLEAKLTISGNSKYLDHFSHGRLGTLRELLNVSQLELEVLADAPGLTRTVTHADGQKCERCWHWETDVGQHAEHPTLCARCVEAVKDFKSA